MCQFVFTDIEIKLSIPVCPDVRIFLRLRRKLEEGAYNKAFSEIRGGEKGKEDFETGISDNSRHDHWQG